MARGEVANEQGGGIRQFINQNPAIIVVILVVLVGIGIYFAVRGMGRTTTGPNYFTTDGGKTYYKGTGVPPLSNGAVMAKVFSCDGGKTTFVGYLMKYTDEGKKAAEDMIRRQVVAPNNGYMVQKPGESEWVAAQSNMAAPGSGNADQAKKFAEITQVKCEDGKPAMMITAQ